MKFESSSNTYGQEQIPKDKNLSSNLVECKILKVMLRGALNTIINKLY